MSRKFLPYLIGYALWFGAALGMILSFSKAESFLLLNPYHSPALDVFFKYYSWLAEWPVFLIGLLPIAFKRWRWTLYYAICEICGVIVVQSIKFRHFTLRPWNYFPQYTDIQLPLVEGVRLQTDASFPSGHTSTFFIFFTCCALLLTYKVKLSSASRALIQISLLLLALVGGYSRIYLSQHFLLDVWFGSLVGTVIPCVVLASYTRRIQK